MRKKLTLFLLALIFICGTFCLGSCNEINSEGEDSEENSDMNSENDIIDYVTVLPDGTLSLVSGVFRLEFRENDGGFGVYLTENGEIMYQNDAPAIISVRDEGNEKESFETDDFSFAYSTVEKSDRGVEAVAFVKTEKGSEFKVTDIYHVPDSGVFTVTRNVTVTADEGDAGFRSVYSFCDPEGSQTAKQHDFFIPSILYKDSEDMVSTAIGSNLNVSKLYVKETRTGLPLAMLRSKSSKYSVAISHLDPDIDVAENVGGGSHGEINSELKYGSVGYKIRDGLSVDFCYPSLECPTVYYSNRQTVGIYHPVDVGEGHEYTLSIIPAKEETYADSMEYTFKKAYMAESPEVTDKIDLEAVYDDTIKLFTKTYREYGTGDVIAAGVPWSIDLARGYATEYTFQMGFVGQQTSVGYNLLKTGYETDNAEMISQGKAIVDFWTSDTIMKDALPIVWWDPRNTESAGQSRGYPSFLRCFCDGMEGVLDAYKIALKNGTEEEKWYNALVKVGDFLVNAQNEDGSFYRCYNTDGSVCTDTSDSRYQGTSKLNTPVAVRFLAKMYELTGEEEYKNSSLRAAEYSYETLYKNHEKYVGGTPDNANTVDKEAAIYALYCFNAAYALSGDEKYLDAAEHAAVSAMSWVYCYDFACPGAEDTAKINPFANGGRTIGFSIIATGHSGADNYSASMYYEMFKLYVYTGDEFYYEAAKLLGFSTKLSTDYDGGMKWKYRAMGPEASNISDFSFSTVGVWLPWSGIVNIKPIGYMKDTFGNCDIREITELSSDVNSLREILDSYGVGGKTDK